MHLRAPRVNGRWSWSSFLPVCQPSRFLLPLALILLGGLSPAPHAGTPPPAADLSPLALTTGPGGRELFVAAATARRVLVVDATTGQVIRTLPLPADPHDVKLAPDGAQLLVALGGAQGQVAVLDPSSGRVLRSLRVGHTPSALAFAGTDCLAVADQFDNAVRLIEWPGGRQLARIPVVREPVALAASPDGRRLFVANLLPAGRADGDSIAAVISVIDVPGRRALDPIPLPNGSTAVAGLGVSPDGRVVYATHGLGRYQMPTTQLDRGWVNTSALSVIDVARAVRINTVLLDDVDLGAANPWGVGVTGDGHWIVVAHAGTHELSVIDQPALLAKLERIARGEKVSGVSSTADEVPNDLSFLVGLRRRVTLPGHGPRGLTVSGNRVSVAEYFSDSLAQLDLGTDAAAPLKPVGWPLGPQHPPSQVRRGEFLFFDATMCFQHWQSCGSCHPDARVDALNWDLLNDGIGNPKNTKNMLWAHRTPPAMSLGVRETAETAVRAGIRHIEFAVRPEEDANAIDAYLKSLKPVASPQRQGAGLSDAAKRGQRLFGQAGCARCHPGPLFTDLRAYDVGTGTGREAGQAFDTPTLVEVWRTAPYLHDGRAATVLELLRDFNPQDRHGKTSSLTPEQLKDLAEYVLSL